ncbi:hypothetical protein IFT48_10205 [Pseudomonas fluorescens]|uniref:hypothetical protein n=1 Tax=Pseudomonas TaxID=286 RepID=UPI001930D430|nr:MULTISPECIES: hypothetical protein [Pseudomonas]MBD8090356.1 hypothetical protein [Pseudomonas fluorescens]MDL2184152.1 hypothetical protein [Pseudomonas sp. ChxA]
MLRKLPRAPFHQVMSGKSGGHSNMMLFWRQRWQAAMLREGAEGVIRRLSTMWIYSLTIKA